ncbi:additional component of nickel ABC transport system [Oleidesulfovibrio alaskensis G20]|uniref:Additional component of nickel ABC transport system n=1 Tax=Oleidesulfovibrio alaskensis (strain ATCC BAA-1058 / DSM 17464 / G20) TaxID=207559 RepID=Q313A4_OLEA2|nr:hypothetical protein [Oleidesulfovibrio alaskensis]ABB37992.1 additional component of nickel ABC transport system [Oleidesulfovibrio alaskensis G20]MBG0774784.1 hypothetical protein [Oleidesulfovibrio alaskensis]
MKLRTELRPGCICVVMLLMLTALPAQAHRVNVFAYAEGDRITVEAGYSKSRPVMGGTVVVADKADGDEFLRGVTDDNGIFVFTVPDAAKKEKADLRITLLAGEGHQDSWIVQAGEYAAETAPRDAAASGVTYSGRGAAGSRQAGAAAGAQGGHVSVDEALLRQVVEEVVERKIAPVRTMLVEQHESGPGFADILGGLGYFAGLFGIAAYLKSRRR